MILGITKGKDVPDFTISCKSVQGHTWQGRCLFPFPFKLYLPYWAVRHQTFEITFLKWRSTLSFSYWSMRKQHQLSLAIQRRLPSSESVLSPSLSPVRSNVSRPPWNTKYRVLWRL